MKGQDKQNEAEEQLIQGALVHLTVSLTLALIFRDRACSCPECRLLHPLSAWDILDGLRSVVVWCCDLGQSKSGDMGFFCQTAAS